MDRLIRKTLAVVLVICLVQPPGAFAQKDKTDVISPVVPVVAVKPVVPIIQQVSLKEPIVAQKPVQTITTTAFLQNQTPLTPVIQTNKTLTTAVAPRENAKKRERYRDDLIDQVDSELNTANSMLTDSINALSKAKSSLDQQTKDLNANIAILSKNLNDQMMVLESMLKEGGLSEGVKNAVQDYLNGTKGFLNSDSGLKQQTDAYIKALSITLLSPIEARIQGSKQYVNDLEAHRNKILNAATMAELTVLGGQFPKLSIPPIPMPPVAASPLVTLDQYMKQGEALIVRVKEDRDQNTKLREALLAKTDSELKIAKDQLDSLNKNLTEAKVKLDQEIKDLDSEVSVNEQALRGTMASLDSILKDPRLSDQTRKELMNYLSQMDTYLADRLDQDKKSYISGLSISMLSSIQAEIQSWTQYTNDLNVYRQKVANAKTAEELIILEGQFPLRVHYPIPMIAMPVSPVWTLVQFKEEGDKLYLKAKEEFDQNFERVSALVSSDLVISFGLPQEMVDKAVKEGLITIKVDPQTLRAVVSIDPSVRIPENAFYLADPLGLHKLPATIHYQLGDGPQMMMPCVMSEDGTSVCPPHVYQLVSANFELEGRFFELNYLFSSESGGMIITSQYGDNRLQSVNIYNGNPQIVCITTPCPTGKLVTEIKYQYKPEDNSILAQMTYHENSQGEVVSRSVQMQRMADGQNHILKIDDSNKEGKNIASSKFLYGVAIHAPCDPLTICEPDVVMLVEINRTDAQGNKLSNIHGIHSVPTIAMVGAVPAYEATVTLPNGKETAVIFHTMEELLAQVLKIESADDSVEQFRKELLAQIDSEVEAGNAELTELGKALEQAKARLKELIDALNSDIAVRVETLTGLSMALHIIVENPAVTDATKQVIQNYQNRLNSYLNTGGLDKQTNEFIQSLSTNVSYIEAQIESLNQYLMAFHIYTEKVLSAQTLEELELLKSQFPPRQYPPELIPPAVMSPVITLDQMIEEGNKLLAKAKEEIDSQNDERAKLIAYLDSIKVAYDSFMASLKALGAEVYGMDPVLDEAALEALISDLGIAGPEAARLRNLLFYFRVMEAVNEVLVTGNWDPYNALSERYLDPAFQAFLEAEGLPPVMEMVVEVIAAPSDIPLEQLRQLVADAKAIYGDNPQTYFDNMMITFQNYNTQVVAALNKINEEFTQLRDGVGEREMLRKELLTQIDAEVNAGNTKLTELNEALAEAKARLTELISALNADIAIRVETLTGLSAALNLIIENPAIIEDTREAVQTYLGQVNAYLNAGGLDQQTNEFIQSLTMSIVSPIEAQLQSWNGYLIALDIYHEKVMSARTLEELELLKEQFPVRMPPSMAMIAAVISPVVTLDQMIETGNKLLAKAKEEIRLFQAKVQVQKALMSTFGFSTSELQTLMLRGLVQITFDPLTLKTDVKLNASLEFAHASTLSLLDNLGDPLGSQALPLNIQFQFTSTSSDLRLNTASYQMAGINYLVTYNDSQPVQVDATGTAGAKLKTIKYEYQDGKMTKVKIEYPNVAAGKVAVRELKPVTLSDGHVYIQKITESDANGNVLAQTEIQYTDINQEVDLQEIMRLDGTGHLLSKSGRVFEVAGSNPPQYFAGIYRADEGRLQGQIPTLEAYLVRAANFEATSAPAQFERVVLDFYDENLDMMTQREFLIHLPPSYNPAEPTPLVLNLHGGSGSSLQQMSMTGMNANADQNGYIAVYPEGLINFWNVEMDTNSKANDLNVDDVGFINALLDYLDANYKINDEQIFVSGLSNGSQMAVRIAEDLNDRIAAVAVVASALTKPEDYQPVNGLPIMVIHGTADPLLPYAGGIIEGGFTIMPAETTVQHYVDINGAQTTPTSYVPYEGYVPNNEIELSLYEGGTNGEDVVFIKVNGGGHTWPGSSEPGGMSGPVSQAIDANAAMWEFFKQNSPEQSDSAVEQFRKELFADVDAEVKAGYAKLTELNQALIVAKLKLDELIKTLNSDISTRTQTLTGLSTALRTIIEQPGVSEETKKAIQDYLNQVGGYLDSGLKKQTDAHIQSLALDIVSPIEAQILSWNQYLIALNSYQAQVIDAKTMEELKGLKELFPMRLEPPMPLLPAVMSPVFTLDQFIETGGKLLAKAKAEIIDAEKDLIRKTLIAKIDSEVATAKIALTDLNKQLMGLQSELKQQISQLQNEVNAGTNSIRATMSKLSIAIQNPAIPADLHQAIDDYLKTMNVYLDPSSGDLQSKTKAYIDALTYNTLTQVQLNIKNQETYLKALEDYRAKVLAAKTTEELRALDSQFPATLFIGLMLAPLPPMPTVQLNQYLSDGQKLLDKASWYLVAVSSANVIGSQFTAEADAVVNDLPNDAVVRVAYQLYGAPEWSYKTMTLAKGSDSAFHTTLDNLTERTFYSYHIEILRPDGQIVVSTIDNTFFTTNEDGCLFSC